MSTRRTEVMDRWREAADPDVFTEDERNDIARVAVAIQMTNQPEAVLPELHQAFIRLLTKTKDLRQHVDHADERCERALAALRRIADEHECDLRDIARAALEDQ